MPYNNRDIFSVYDILSTERDDETNTISSQLGNFIDEKVISSEAEVWQHCGFASRPPNCVAGSDDCPQAVAINQSDQDVVIAERDIKSQQIYGGLKAGETCLYATGEQGTGQARLLLKSNGSINAYTKKGNAESGQGLGIFIDPENDRISIIISNGNGIVIDSSGISFVGQIKIKNLAAESINVGNIKSGGLTTTNFSCKITKPITPLVVTGTCTVGGVPGIIAGVATGPIVAV